ncbi:MAG: hypothetical protein R6V11_02100 [Ectothiorhodospiraceae bacterium]
MERLNASVLALVLITSTAAGAASAETLLINAVEDQEAAELPDRGVSKDQVREQYGQPAERHDAVGEPPITRWDYDDYSLYFEHDRLLHTVARQ